MHESSPPSAPGTVTLDISQGIARLTIHNPARYNAMSLAMWQRLAALTRQADRDPGVRLLVLEGSGDKAFVSGADISEFGAVRNSPDAVARYGAAVSAAQQGLTACSKPVVAAIRGICMGGGIGLALACDLRYCTDDARFRMPAARLGLGYDVAGIRRAVDVLGLAHATEIFFSAKDFDGAEAQRIGMVQSCIPGPAFSSAVQEIATRIAGNAPLTLRAAKLAFRHVIDDPLARDAATVEQAIQACFDSADYQEGQQAFQEKRPPRFTGR